MARPPHDDNGAIHMLESALATVLLLSTLAYINSCVMAPAAEDTPDLRLMSADITHVLSYRSSSVEHPNLSYAFSSPVCWGRSSGHLGHDIRDMLPHGTYYYFSSPYGELGDRPPDGVGMCARPIEIFSDAGETIMDCELILWRP